MKLHSLILFTAISTCAIATGTPPLAPLLMESTYKIEGPGIDGKTCVGTCFIFLKPIPNETNRQWIIMITADHVLAEIASDSATLNIRQKQEDGTWLPRPTTVTIRNNGIPLWTKHPDADVAAMLLPFPSDLANSHRWLTESLLAGDDVFEERDIQPGDELMCLGYPLTLQSSDSGFPILRSGRIASYPVRPSSIANTFLYDIPVYGGNSGGPVFFDYRKRRIPGEDSMKWVDIIGIAGLVSKDVSNIVRVEDYFQSTTRRYPIGLAVVIPAEFIKQTIKLLVSKETEQIQ